MQPTNAYAITLGSLAIAVAIFTATAASAKPPCKPGASQTPVSYYLNHHCYPGLNTYTSNPPQSQAIVPPTAQVKLRKTRRRMMKFNGR